MCRLHVRAMEVSDSSTDITRPLVALPAAEVCGGSKGVDLEDSLTCDGGRSTAITALEF